MEHIYITIKNGDDKFSLHSLYLINLFFDFRIVNSFALKYTFFDSFQKFITGKIKKKDVCG